MRLRNERRRLLWFGLLLALAPLSASARAVRIYVTDNGGDHIEAIDPVSNKVVQVISGIPVPHGIGFSHDHNQIYVSSESKNVLDVVDRLSGRIIGEVRLSGHPNNIATTKDGRRVLVAIRAGKGSLDVVDTATRSLVKNIPVNGPLHNVYVTPDGKYAVTGSIEDRVLTVIDLRTDRPTWEVRFGAGVRPMAIEANPEGSTKRIFVELSKLHGFAIVDFATRKEVGRISLPDLPFEAKSGREAADEPCHGIAISPDGKSLWVDSILDNAAFRYALPDLELLGHVSLPIRRKHGRPLSGAVPYWISFTPDSQRVFVSNLALDSVSVIDSEAMELIAMIPVGKMPKRSDTLVLR